MIAVVVRIEDVLHRLGRNLLDIREGGPCPAGEVGVHHDQVVLHLDDDVVAVAEILQIALAEPDPRPDLLYGFRSGLRPGDEKGHGGKAPECGEQKDASHKLNPDLS